MGEVVGPTVEPLKAAGSAAFARGAHALAVREFSRALALAPADQTLLCNRSAALLAAGAARDALRDAEEAERAALRAGGSAGEPLKPLYRQAQALVALGLWDDAVAVCVRALSASPSHPQLLSLLSLATASGADISGDAVAQALARAKLAALSAQAEQVPHASAAAAAASELDDDGARAGPPELTSAAAGDDGGGEPSGAAYVADCRARGNEAFGGSEYGQAVAWYSHGLREAPDDAVLCSNRAAARLALGQLRAAAADAARAVELQPRYLRGALRAAICHLRIGAYGAARDYCLGALDAQPTCAHALALMEEARTAEERAAEVALLASHAAQLSEAEAADADAAGAQCARGEGAAGAGAGGKGGAAGAWSDVLEHTALLLADAPLDSGLLAARARALAALGDLDGAALLVTRAREKGASGAPLDAEWLACAARDGPLAEAVAFAADVLAAAEGGALAEPGVANSGAETESADGGGLAGARARPPSAHDEASSSADARLSELARRVLALDAASRAARAAEVGATGDEARRAALGAVADALRLCERGGATEAELRAREGALHAAARDWAAAAAACSAGLRTGAPRASSGSGVGGAARKALLLRRALCHAQLADHAAAAADYADALRLDPALSAARRGLAAAERALRLRATAGLYATLGVHVGAGDSELRRAYHSLALRWHPDRHAAGGEAARIEAEVRFKEIAAAFELLSDPQRRARYDVDMHLRDGG